MIPSPMLAIARMLAYVGAVVVVLNLLLLLLAPYATSAITRALGTPAP